MTALTSTTKILIDVQDANGVGTSTYASVAELLTGLGALGSILSSLNAIGYTTGAGGAVTQLTSRTTGVTLNKACGAITLFSAAGSASWRSFTVTNSLVAANDIIDVCQQSGTDLNQIMVTNVAAGSFVISHATTGGTTTEAPVFNFAVTKGSAS